MSTVAFPDDDWTPEDDADFIRFMEELDEIPASVVEDFLKTLIQIDGDTGEAWGTQ